MRIIRISIVLATLLLSSQAFSQFYYTFGPKLVRSNFSYYYYQDGAYEFDNGYGGWSSVDSIDFVHDRGMNFGICATLGHSFKIENKPRLRGLFEGQGYLRFLRIPRDYGSYSDFSLRTGISCSVGRMDDSHRVFALIGLGYASADGFKEVKAIGFNWSVGYENVLDRYVVGARLTGNLFARDLYNHNQAFLSQIRSRKMNTIGLTLYVGSVK